MLGFEDTFLILVQYSLRRMARRRMLRPPRAALMTIPEMLECEGAQQLAASQHLVSCSGSSAPGHS